MLLETGTKAILVRKWQKKKKEKKKNRKKTWLNGFSALWKVEVVSDNLGYLAKKICKPSIESIAWFLLPDYSKM